MPYFEIFRAGRKLRDVAVEGFEAVIGRDEQAQVHLPGDAVSRQHARVFARAGAWVIEDLATKNGTFVNGAREYSCELHDGDRVQVDEFVLAFHRPPDELVPEVPQFQTKRERRQAEARARGVRWEPHREEQTDPELERPSQRVGTMIVGMKELQQKRQTALARLGPHLERADDAEWIQPLRKEQVTIGSAAKECDVKLEGASRLGVAVVQRTGDGGWKVQWRGLFGGIRVDGRRRRELLLEDGASFEVHRVAFTFRAGRR